MCVCYFLTLKSSHSIVQFFLSFSPSSFSSSKNSTPKVNTTYKEEEDICPACYSSDKKMYAGAGHLSNLALFLSNCKRLFCWWWASLFFFHFISHLTSLTHRCWAPEVRGACSSCCQEERSSQFQWCCQEIKNRMRDSVTMIHNNAIVIFQQRWKANALFCLVWK